MKELDETCYFLFKRHLPEIINDFIPTKYKLEKDKNKCLLPSCDNLTDHNGRYCCAEHCKQHRRLR